MLYAGYTGWVEILIIALCVFWLLNAYRKNQILKKVDEEMERRRNSRRNEQVKEHNRDSQNDIEDVDYEEVS